MTEAKDLPDSEDELSEPPATVDGAVEPAAMAPGKGAGKPSASSSRSSSRANAGGPVLSTGDVLKAAGVVFALYLSLKLLWSVYALAVMAFLGVLFGLAVSRAVEPVARIGFRLGGRRIAMPRGLAAALVVFAVIGSIAAVVAWSAPTLSQQSAELQRKFPQALESVDDWIESKRGTLLGPLITDIAVPAVVDTSLPIATRDSTTAFPPPQRVEPVADTAAAPGGTVERLISRVVTSARGYLFPFITSAFTAAAGLVVVILLAIFVAADPGMYHRGIMHMVPHHHRARAGDILTMMAFVLRKWLRAQFIGMVIIGVMSTITLCALGIPAALPLGILAGILEFIPNVGPLLAAIPAVLLGFADGPEKALTVLVAYILIQQVEGTIIVPLLMQEQVDLPPVLTILAQAVMAIVFGFLGLLIAVPLLAIVLVGVKMIYVEGVIGDNVVDLEDAD